MKIGILTYHYVVNSGAILQSLGHYHSLKKLFPTAQIEIIDYRSKKIEKRELIESFKGIIKLRKGGSIKAKKYLLYRKFLKTKLPLSKQKLISDNLDEITTFINKQNYDYIITGSDEVWKIQKGKFVRGFPNIYWLPNILNSKKIASAASANGSNPKLLESEDTRQEIRKLIDSFNVIGVRDNYTLQLVKNLSKHPEQIYKVPDPTFSHDFKVDLTNKLKILGISPLSQKYIGLLISSDEPEFEMVSVQIKKFAQKIGFKTISFGQYNKYSDINISDKIDPLEWAEFHSILSFCITDRFHSTIFCLKNLIPFLVVENKRKYPGENKGKIIDLLTDLSIADKHHVFLEQENIKNLNFSLLYESVSKNWDKSAVELKVNDLRAKFLNHLKNAIDFSSALCLQRDTEPSEKP